MMKELKLFFKISINMTGMPLKPIRMQMKLPIILETFCAIYDTFFLLKKMKIKTKDLESPRITKGIKKFSKKKESCNESV